MKPLIEYQVRLVTFEAFEMEQGAPAPWALYPEIDMSVLRCFLGEGV